MFNCKKLIYIYIYTITFIKLFCDPNMFRVSCKKTKTAQPLSGQVCKFYNTSTGCKRGKHCRFLHICEFSACCERKGCEDVHPCMFFNRPGGCTKQCGRPHLNICRDGTCGGKNTCQLFHVGTPCEFIKMTMDPRRLR